MLSNIASYLGYQLASTEVESDVAAGVEVRLSAVEEDEWLLVEKHRPGEMALALSSTSPNTLPGARPSSVLQESWYLTPPPSFTSRGPVHMETSPLENLLIEHPSMSVYQKSDKKSRRKTPQSSPSASEGESPLRPPCDDGTFSLNQRKERYPKLPRNKYSKKTSNKRATVSSSDDALSLPSASEDEALETKEIRLKNFVKSPRRSLNTELKNFSKKVSIRRPDHSSSDEMISIPSNNEDETPTVQSFAPQRKLYSDVLRSKPKAAIVVNSPSTAQNVISEEAAADLVGSVAQASVAVVEVRETLMVIEEGPADRDIRRRAMSTLPSQHRQRFLNRSAQKLEQRIGCEAAKRNTMGRNNKAREINSRNKRQRRSDMMQRHSGANNNRKCC